MAELADYLEVSVSSARSISGNLPTRRSAWTGRQVVFLPVGVGPDDALTDWFFAAVEEEAQGIQAPSAPITTHSRSPTTAGDLAGLA